MKLMRYEIPTIRSTKTGFDNLTKLFQVAEESVDQDVTISFEKCGFFDGNMAAALQVILEKIVDLGKSVEFSDLPLSIETILCKNEFPCQYGYGKIRDANATTLPHEIFLLSESSKFAKYLENNLPGKGVPRMTDGLGKKFRQSIFEMFENCAMHSRSIAGISVCGQYFPKEQHLDLTIADAGVGIRTNVQKFLSIEISSVDAIKWAMIEGNTTKTGTQPGGFGLKLLQGFIELNNGKVQIVSRDGFYEFSGGIKRYSTLKGDFPGTTINLQINTGDKKSYALASEISSDNIF